MNREAIEANARRRIRPGLLAAALAFLPWTAEAQRNDSLWNGVLVGAAAGTVLGATVVGPLISDCSECSGFNVPLTFAVVGAGAGAALGAGIDALLLPSCEERAPARPRSASESVTTDRKACARAGGVDPFLSQISPRFAN